MIDRCSFNPNIDIIVDIKKPLIYATKDKNNGEITLGRFTEDDVNDLFFEHFLSFLENSSCSITSSHLFLIHKYFDYFSKCNVTASFTIFNKEFEPRKMKLVGSANVAKYLRTHDVDDSFSVVISK